MQQHQQLMQDFKQKNSLFIIKCIEMVLEMVGLPDFMLIINTSPFMFQNYLVTVLCYNHLVKVLYKM